MQYDEKTVKDIYYAPCIDVALALGLEVDNKRSNKSAWRIKDWGGLFIFKESHKGWVQNSTGEKGHAVELVKLVNGSGKLEAMKYISENVLGKVFTPANFDKTISGSLPPKMFEMPKQCYPSRARWYLSDYRGIDRQIIDRLIERNKIIQTQKCNNVGFVGFDKTGKARYCNLRGTYPENETQYKGECEGSDKRYSFSMINTKSDRVVIFESAIDALSHATLCKLRGARDWRSDSRLSLGGYGDKALIQFLNDFPQTKRIVIAVDNDETGNKQAEILKTKLNDLGYTNVCRIKSAAKDFNSDLMEYRSLEKQGYESKMILDHIYKGTSLEKNCEQEDEFECDR